MNSLLDDLNWKLQEAKNYYSMGKYERTIEELNDLLARISEEQPHSNELLEIKIEASFIQAKSLNIATKSDEAKILYDEIENFTAETIYETYGQALALLGNAMIISRTKTEQAIELLDKSIQLFQVEEQPKNAYIATAYNALGICYFLKGKISQAQSYGLRAIELFHREGRSLDLSLAFNNMGILHRNLGNYDKAIEYLKEAMKIQELLNNKRLISYSLNNIGLCLYNKGFIEEALDYFTRSLKMKRAHYSTSSTIASTLSNIGSIKAEMGQFDEAFDILIEALELKKLNIEPVFLARSYNELAKLERWRGNLTESIYLYDKALELLEPLDNEMEIVSTLTGLIFSLVDSREIERTNMCLNKLHDIRKEKQLPIIDIQVEYANGYYLSAVNRKQEAAESFRRCEGEAHALGDYNFITLSMLRLAEVYINDYFMDYDLAKLESSEKKLVNVCLIAKNHNFRVIQIEGLILRGKIKLLKADMGSAKELFRIAQSRAESFGFVKATQEIKSVNVGQEEIITDQTIDPALTSGQDQAKIREEIGEMLTPEEIHTGMLDNVLHLAIPWPSKQNILFTCVQDIHFISSTVNAWKENSLISDDDYNYLIELMAEKQKA
ncbi:MAG: tetratricopeptide repeat protein [Candidatus Kariarchaeaceae archaeon]